MKKNIFFAAIAALAFALTACEPEDITRINPGNDVAGPLVKTTSDLNNTHWTCTVSLADLLVGLTGFDMGCIDSIDAAAFETYLNFDGTYAHFTFSDNVEIYGLDPEAMSMEQITGVDYEYSYDGTTHTGSLNGTDDEGNTASLTFTYDDATDAITFILPMSFDGETTEFDIPMVFNRAI